MPNPPPEAELRAMLAEALAQYRAHPGEYLEGVVTGLMRMLDMEPDRSWCDDEAQERNARGRPATARVRDYLNGTKTAMAWADGGGGPPLSIVLTVEQDTDRPEPPR
jgi:hypothetical protein